MSHAKLPRVTINGERYFKDARLQEYRNVENPHDRIRFGEVECRECDEDNPHTKIEGQRRTTCDACGSESHWMRATYDEANQLARFDDGEYGSETPIDAGNGTGAWRLLDGQVFRLTCCCWAPARRDLHRPLKAKKGAPK